MFEVVIWSFFGALAGWIASIANGKSWFACLQCMAIGIAGAIIGGTATVVAEHDPRIGINPSSALISFMTAAVLIAIYLQTKKAK